jgi:hypothetical protein
MRLVRALALALALVFPGLAVHGEPSWYRSDAAGFASERMPDPESPKARPLPDYWLSIEVKTGSEIRNLYHAGSLVERREKVQTPGGGGYSERVFRNGNLVSETSYGPRQESLEEKAWVLVDGAVVLSWREACTYASGKLVTIERFGGDGASLGSRKYRYDPRGRLVSVELSGWYGETSDGAIPGATVPRLAWNRSKGSSILRVERFDSSGRVATVRRADAKKDLSVIRYAYAATGALASSTEEDLASGLRTLTTFGPGGFASAIELSRKGKREEVHAFTWDAQGRLLTDSRTFPIPIETSRFSYDAPEGGTREEHRIGNEVLYVAVVDATGGRMEETWDQGAPFVRAWFVNGVKVREEFVEDGEVSRERSFQ